MNSDRQDKRPTSTRDPKVPKTVAVALESQDEDSPAKITASGRGFLAEQILEVAFANDVKVREDADLVQILAAVDVDSDIPTEAFAAVAEVLSYVYQANAKPSHSNPGTVGTPS